MGIFALIGILFFKKFLTHVFPACNAYFILFCAENDLKVIPNRLSLLIFLQMAMEDNS
jgi:hypothetical protein